MEVFLLLVPIAIALLKYMAEHAQKVADAQEADAEKPAPAEIASEDTSSPVERIRAQKREQMARVEQWRAAKTQQDDAQQLHSIKMDTCESKLESLRVLYDAGILDREEYASRVARVKAKHNEA